MWFTRSFVQSVKQRGKAKKKYEEEEDGNRGGRSCCVLCIRFIVTSVDSSFSGESSNS